MNFGLKKVHIVMSDEFIKKVKEAQQQEFDHYRSFVDTKEKALKHFGQQDFQRQILFYAPDELKDDEDVVIAATIKNPYEFKHASKRLKEDRKFVLSLMRISKEYNVPRIFYYLDRVLRSKIKKYTWNSEFNIIQALEIVIETEKLNECMPVTSKAVTTGAKRL